MPKPALSEVPEPAARPLAGRAPNRTARSAICPCRLQASPSTGSSRPAEQRTDLWFAVQRERAYAVSDRLRCQASRRRDRLLQRPPHLESAATASSSRPLRCSGRWLVSRPLPMDSRREQLLSARSGAQPCVPRQVCCRPAQTACRQQTRLSRETDGVSIAEGFLCAAPEPVSYRLGGLFQASLWQRRACAALSRLLHPSHCDFQSPARFSLGRSHLLSGGAIPLTRTGSGSCRSARKNSCGGSCFMCCPGGSFASGASASSPTGVALNSSL